SGPRGCGKTSSARIMARSLNCAKGPTPDPCGECTSCRALAPEGAGSIDVTELDAASHGGVDDARELRDRAFYAPAESRYRVFIIDEAHMVTTQGFNALLKIVEEPPEHLIFIFATTEPEKVLPTIRSRTHHDPFRLIPPSAMRDRLRDLILVRSVPDAATRGLVSAPEDELGRMTAQAERVGLGTLTRYAEIVHNGLLEMRGATAPRLLLELLCARMLLPSVSDDEAAVLQRLERLERRVTVGGGGSDGQ